MMRTPDAVIVENGSTRIIVSSAYAVVAHQSSSAS